MKDDEVKLSDAYAAYDALEIGDSVSTLYGLDVIVTLLGYDFAGPIFQGEWAHNGDIKSRWFRPDQISAVASLKRSKLS